jgi:hypothetical protein
MFVNDVKLMESPKTVVPSTVWAYLIDLVFGSLGHSLYLSTSFRFVFLNSFANRKVDSLGFDVCAANKLARQIVQCDPKVVNSISENQRYAVGDRRKGLQNKLSAIRFRMELRDTDIRVSPEESNPFRIQISDMLFALFDF